MEDLAGAGYFAVNVLFLMLSAQTEPRHLSA